MFRQLFFILLLSICCRMNDVVAANSSKCLQGQKVLLLQLRNNLTYNSEASIKLATWDERIDCCQWQGITCNVAGQVIGIDLSYESISGSINNSALPNLKFLSVIVLDWNDLSSPIPEFFADFSNLTVLSLRSCNLTGEVPEKIFQVPTLQKIDLSYNYVLRGSLPEFPSNASLESLVLSYTNFSGSLPKSIGLLTKLIDLELLDCNFTGQIPSSIENLTQLRYLDFSQNLFTGSVPSFRQSKNLTMINFQRNNFSGEISSSHWVGLENLIVLILSENSLSGIIPVSLFSLPSLQFLDLSANNFTGQITELQNVTSSSLIKLYLAGNKLEGPIPEFFFELHHLQELALSYNKFNGTVKWKKFTKLKNLVALVLSYNRLSVDTNISESELALLPHLSILRLASCNLYNISFLEKQSELTLLDLSINHIKGKIPNWIWDGGLTDLNLSRNQFTHLQEPYRFRNIDSLDLHLNLLTGEIPLPPRAALYVDFSSNKFTTSIPPDIGNHLSSVVFLSIANNTINGTIPSSICNATNLEVLDLSSNKLSGRIPACLAEQSSRSLKVLNLGRNNLRGNLPGNFSEKCSLETIDLRQNNLEGKIPRSISNCRKLKVLNLGNNKITDTLPCWLKSLSNLHVLVLRFNNFHGNIDCSGVNYTWPALQIIDLASNNFSGILPRNIFMDLEAMKVNSVEPHPRLYHLHFQSESASIAYYQDSVILSLKGREVTIGKILIIFNSIDLSNNSFIEGIPETVGELKSLRLLNLSHNALTGQIPAAVGNLKQLESLDLSFNKLEGRIPEKLSDLTFLSLLNLSYNELVGMIPQGNQMQTFSESSFVGNKGLCGFPLHKTCNSDIEEAALQPESEDVEGQFFSRTEMYVSVALGFAAGLAIIFLPLLVSRRWRECYNKLIDGLIFWVFSKVGVKKRQRNTSISEIYWKKKARKSHCQVPR
uniref:Receptor-like protein 12 n=2 Tax=Nicotiana tabacum TaxID=4097 RepID=A0A1S4BZ61_TOBAC|nr:PREDICTED: receptor-like protein 12 [Nicotiana tabacum]